VTEISDDVKACCATAYSSEAARFLLGDRFHPGGATLTARLVRALGVRAGATIVDVASGPGTSAIQAAEQAGCGVVGVDLSERSVAAAGEAAVAAGLGDRVRFVVGDAEALPLEDASVDGALCECALCTFPDKPRAAAEIARVLRPGARVALSDITARPERLTGELAGLGGWIACIADARPLDDVAAILTAAGLVVETVERHDAALAEMVERVQARLTVARMLGGRIPGLEGRVGEAEAIAAAAADAVAAGDLGYGVVVARRPAPASS
jgi:hypothetical protein